MIPRRKSRCSSSTYHHFYVGIQVYIALLQHFSFEILDTLISHSQHTDCLNQAWIGFFEASLSLCKLYCILLHCYKAFCWDYTLSDKIQMSFTRKKLSLHTNFECFHFKRKGFFYKCLFYRMIEVKKSNWKIMEFYFFYKKVKNSIQKNIY